MPRICSVQNCRNRCGREVGVKFFSFPSITDKRGRDLPAGKIQREKWILALRVADFPTDKQQIRNRSICSAHFSSGYPSEIPEHPDYVPHLNMGYNTKPLDATKYYRLQRRNKLKYSNAMMETKFDVDLVKIKVEQPDKLEELDYKIRNNYDASEAIEVKREFSEESTIINYGERSNIADYVLNQIKEEQCDVEIKTEPKSEIKNEVLIDGFEFINCSEPKEPQFIENDTSNLSHKADICNKHLETQKKLRSKDSPSRRHLGEKLYECEVCGNKYKQKRGLDHHMKQHLAEKPYKCDVCEYKCLTKYSLKVHMRLHTGERPFKCDICDSKFIRKYHLLAHVGTHTGEKPYECEVCGNKYKHKFSLDMHMKLHLGEKPYKCEFCEHKCAKRYTLKVHMRSHTGERPFKCDICESKFLRKYHLVEHVRNTHAREKPLKCDICSKQFLRKYLLDEHIRLHTGEKPFKCELCGKEYRRKNSLVAHIRLSHSEKQA